VVLTVHVIDPEPSGISTSVRSEIEDGMGPPRDDGVESRYLNAQRYLPRSTGRMVADAREEVFRMTAVGGFE
jgi:hypothetical protein